MVEDTFGRAMTLVPGDLFLGTTGYRESTRWAVGGTPKGGLKPGTTYWVIAECGVVGDLEADTPMSKTFVAQARYLGAITGDDSRVISLSDFAVQGAGQRSGDHKAPLYIIAGTSAEVGKTTAGIAVLRTLLLQRYDTVVVLKATGTSSITEIGLYQDHGAAQVFDCVDFGLPTTYGSNPNSMKHFFDKALDACLSTPADAVLVECGGDLLGANVPIFLRRLRRRRARAKVVLAAADAVGAWGGTQMLRKMGWPVDLITGPCTDTPTLQQRTEVLCRTPAMNMSRD
ncbi:MAG: hypothetical protein GEU95_00175 [Rhizobiales bacterium]|nr:hypothetical protein [Hyphomicrobiales bacterium]